MDVQIATEVEPVYIATSRSETAAIALYDHWRRDSRKIGAWDTASEAMKDLFRTQAHIVLTNDDTIFGPKFS